MKRTGVAAAFLLASAGVVVERPDSAPYVFMMCLPALRFLTGPLPPLLFAARRFAAVIRPPLLFFAMIVNLRDRAHTGASLTKRPAGQPSLRRARREERSSALPL